MLRRLVNLGSTIFCVVSRMEQCENAHYSFWRENPFHLITLLTISMAECLVANTILYCIVLSWLSYLLPLIKIQQGYSQCTRDGCVRHVISTNVAF